MNLGDTVVRRDRQTHDECKSPIFSTAKRQRGSSLSHVRLCDLLEVATLDNPKPLPVHGLFCMRSSALSHESCAIRF